MKPKENKIVSVGCQNVSNCFVKSFQVVPGHTERITSSTCNNNTSLSLIKSIIINIINIINITKYLKKINLTEDG